MNRRTFLSSAVTIPGAWSAFNIGTAKIGTATHRPVDFPPVRTITQGPGYHWFGYYDKLQFDRNDRFVLANQVSFEHRTPTNQDIIKVGMIDTADQDRWIELGESSAWSWQQGCMLQWLPGSDDQLIWNDRLDGNYVSHVFNTTTRHRRTLDSPVYTVCNDGDFALCADFSRIQVMRPGYGYVGIDDPWHDDMAPVDSGVFKVNLQTGRSALILSLADAAAIPHQGNVLSNVKHYFNHLLVSPDSRRFIVLHRWRRFDQKKKTTVGGFVTRMLTANIDGSGVFVLDPSGHTSHFIWRDPDHVCMWTRPQGKKAAYYLIRDRTSQIELVGDGVMTRNGHNTYLPGHGNKWILSDTYPDGNRMQKPYLYHVPDGQRFWLGEFESPPQYSGEWRCDTHPRSSNDGRKVCIDSPHGGNGRQIHLLDVGEILDSV